MDHNRFRDILNQTCNQVVESHRMSSGEKEIAQAKLEGIFLGALACAKALGENPYEGGMMDVVREVSSVRSTH